MSKAEPTVADFAGRYSGSGMWIDITGESKKYEIMQEIRYEEGHLLVSYTHNFVEEDSVTTGEFVFDFVTDTICNVMMQGTNMGNGYCFGPYFHFNIQVGETFVETSYTLTDDQIEVRGSSTKNAQGRFIGWYELLAKDASR